MHLLIVDDHAVVRRGTMNIVADRYPACRFSEASTLHHARQILGESGFDLVILDISLPDGSGLSLLEELTGERPELPVIVLSMHHEAEYALRCASLGARGYLSKNSAPEELGEALATVLDGGVYISPSLAPESVPSDPLASLSAREREVAARMARGDTLTTIARDMGLSIKTTSTYRSRAMRKLGVFTTSAFIRRMLEHGIPGA